MKKLEPYFSTNQILNNEFFLKKKQSYKRIKKIEIVGIKRLKKKPKQKFLKKKSLFKKDLQNLWLRSRDCDKLIENKLKITT
jgi:hypothetical protein